MKNKRTQKNGIRSKENLIVERQINSGPGYRVQGAETNISSAPKVVYSKNHIRIPQLREAPKYPVYKREIIIRDCNLQRSNLEEEE